jgi:putative addiction module component (TIGR02574 family)
MNADLEQLSDLSVSEKLQLVEDLWDDIASNPKAVPVYDWQKEELRKRKAKYLQNPSTGVTWEEAKKKIRSGRGEKADTAS